MITVRTANRIRALSGSLDRLAQRLAVAELGEAAETLWTASRACALAAKQVERTAAAERVKSRARDYAPNYARWAAIAALRASGATIKVCAEQFGVSRSRAAEMIRLNEREERKAASRAVRLEAGRTKTMRNEQEAEDAGRL